MRASDLDSTPPKRRLMCDSFSILPSRVFLALALFNLERFDEAEESYKKAVDLSPGQALARQVRSLIG